MAYKKNVWKSKDRITKEKLNNIEEGIYEAHKNIDNYQSTPLDELDKIKADIDELFQSVSNGKTLIASAITDKGVTTSNTGTFQQLAKNIKAIQSTSLNNVIVIIDGKKYKLTEDSNGDITATLINFSINNTLTNCRNNNSSTSISYGSSYSATITANSNFELSNVIVTMGGTDITSTAYSNGNISISSVTGDIEIIATATASVIVNTYTITKTLNNCSLSNTASEISEGGTYSATVTLDTDYEIDDINITMGGRDITSSAFNSNTNAINISNINGNIEITIRTVYTNKECTGITLNSTSLTFTDNNPITLIANVTPVGCTDTIYWYTNNETIATVSNGVITPINNGNCTITVACGSQIATCNIYVNIVVPETIEERVMSLMYPMPQDHECIPSGAPTDWKYQSKWVTQQKPTGWTSFEGWIQVYRVEGSDFTVNTGVEIRDYEVYGWRNGNWELVKKIAMPQGNFYAENFANDANASFSQSLKTNTNSVTIKLTSDMVLDTRQGVKNVCYHPYTGQLQYASNFEYIFTCVRMRKVKWNNTGIDDLDTSRYCANCGGIWWTQVGATWISDGSNNKEIGHPKITEVTTDWKLFAMTTVPENWTNGFPITEI